MIGFDTACSVWSGDDGVVRNASALGYDPAVLRTGFLVTCFITLWLFWDDMQVEHDSTFSIDDVVSALAGDAAPAAPNRYLAAWQDLGTRLRATQSAAWLRRLGASMRQWLDNARIETALARELRATGCSPAFDCLLACRTVSIGMFPTFYLIELCEGFELAPGIHDHASIVALKQLASRLVGMGNDLEGLAKDIRSNWLNLVRVLAREQRASLAEAFEAVVQLHNRDVLAFDATSETLPTFGGENDALVKGWIQAVRQNV